MGAQQLKAVDKFRAGDIAANDNDARLTGCALPVVQRHRWIKKMLHAVKHKRHLNADQMYDAFHAQDVGPAQPDERVEPKIKRIRVNRIVQDNGRRSDPRIMFWQRGCGCRGWGETGKVIKWIVETKCRFGYEWYQSCQCLI